MCLPYPKLNLQPMVSLPLTLQGNENIPSNSCWTICELSSSPHTKPIFKNQPFLMRLYILKRLFFCFLKISLFLLFKKNVHSRIYFFSWCYFCMMCKWYARPHGDSCGWLAADSSPNGVTRAQLPKWETPWETAAQIWDISCVKTTV